MAEKLQGQTINFAHPPQIVASASIAGPEEGKGPYGAKFDLVCEDVKYGEKTWEKGEQKMVQEVIKLALDKAKISMREVDYIFGGDLLNELITANFIARDLDAPFLGIYGACSTMIEGLGLGAVFLDGGYADCVLAFASSNYQTAERQYRTPIEYGAQYPPYKQWTVTGAGAYILGWLGGKVQITQATFGQVIDQGITDANDMGTAMAPAAANTLLQHFKDVARGPADYDLILSGDLGEVGKRIVIQLLQEENIDIRDVYDDCGAMLYGGNKRYGAGGSGVAATAIMLSSVIIPRLIKGEYQRIFIMGTGALLSPLSVLQGESIPAVAHGIVVERI